MVPRSSAGRGGVGGWALLVLVVLCLLLPERVEAAGGCAKSLKAYFSKGACKAKAKAKTAARHRRSVVMTDSEGNEFWEDLPAGLEDDDDGAISEMIRKEGAKETLHITLAVCGFSVFLIGAVFFLKRSGVLE